MYYHKKRGLKPRGAYMILSPSRGGGLISSSKTRGLLCEKVLISSKYGTRKKLSNWICENIEVLDDKLKKPKIQKMHLELKQLTLFKKRISGFI